MGSAFSPYSEEVFLSDLEQLTRLYRTASPEMKEKMGALLDKVYLLVDSAANSDDMEKITAIKEMLDQLFYQDITSRHEKE